MLVQATKEVTFCDSKVSRSPMKLLPSYLLVLIVAAVLPAASLAELPVSVAVDNPHLVFSGRRDDAKAGEVRIGYSGSRVRIAFEGSVLGLRIDSANPNWVEVFIDGKRTEKLKVEGKNGYYEIASGLGNGVLTAEIVKVTEGSIGEITFKGFALPEGGKVVPWPTKETKKIEFIGDSITCGYGIEAENPKTHFSPETENFCDTYAWLAARALNAEYLVVARSGIGILRNYNGPYEGNADNMPAIYDRTLIHDPSLKWEPARFTPDVVCINLGTNDFSTTGVDKQKFTDSYLSFGKMLMVRYPAAKIVLLAGPMQNSQELKDILADVTETLNRDKPGTVSFCELSQQGALGFGADFHPNKEQAKINGAELAKYLSGLMGWPLENTAQ